MADRRSTEVERAGVSTDSTFDDFEGSFSCTSVKTERSDPEHESRRDRAEKERM